MDEVFTMHKDNLDFIHEHWLQNNSGVLLSSGDIGQTLLIIREGTRAEQVQATITQSTLSTRIKYRTLTTNMRI